MLCSFRSGTTKVVSECWQLVGLGDTYIGEPGFLPEVWSLAAHLQVLPATLQVLLRKGIVADRMVLVVDVDQVLYDSTRLR